MTAEVRVVLSQRNDMTFMAAKPQSGLLKINNPLFLHQYSLPLTRFPFLITCQVYTACDTQFGAALKDIKHTFPAGGNSFYVLRPHISQTLFTQNIFYA